VPERKVAVVTGGASGIGAACARKFAQSGWHVIIADMNAENGGTIVTELTDEELSGEFVRLDVSAETDVNEFAEAAFRDQEAVHAVINSAGVLQNAVRLPDMPIKDYDTIMSVNLRGPVLTGLAFGKRMCQARTGSIIHLCSMASIRPSAQPAYSVSKAGLMMLTEVMAAEFGPSGVRVNAVAPGYTMTPAMRSRIEKGERDPKLVIEKSALRRFVEPEDVAEAVFFLCSDAARSITGVMLPIDCGWLTYSAYSAYSAYAAAPD
jgi:NAD(P)-dependent dehydrogenase (short-subunit alcohol dehydrogenase family)